MTRSPELRLPRSLAAEPLAAQLPEEIRRRGEPLWEGAALSVATASFAGELRATIEAARSAGRLVRGLASAGKALDAEARGQALADQKSGDARGVRVSRLLLLSNDGAERFYRQVESLLREHGERALAFRLDVDAETLGSALFGDGAMARLLLLEHKSSVADAILAVARQWRQRG